MKHMNYKLAKLLYEGFSINTLENLNSKQLTALYEKVSKKETKEEETKLTKVYNLGDKNDKDKFIDAAKNVTDKNKVNFDSSKDTASVSEKEIKEKAVSKKQQQFFGIVRGMQKGDIPKKGNAGKVSKEISVKDAKDFAKTKHKGLPKKVESKETKKEEKNEVKKLEENIMNLINNYVYPNVTKKEIFSMIKRYNR